MLRFIREYSRQLLTVSFSQRTDQEKPTFRILSALSDYLAVDDSPSRSDLIFVLAGRTERKTYGLQLFGQGIAPRIILSVGRFEVRDMDKFGFQDLKLREMVKHMAPAERHFFIELSKSSRTVIPAGIKHVGTFGELSAMAAYLSQQPVCSMILVSTSIHLRRVRWCCQRISGLKRMKIFFVPVPEQLSSFRRDNWWKQRDHWSYVNTEYAKLLAYPLWFRDRE
jgi:DUF218 domain